MLFVKHRPFRACRYGGRHRNEELFSKERKNFQIPLAFFLQMVYNKDTIRRTECRIAAEFKVNMNTGACITG